MTESSQNIALARPTFDEREERAVIEVLRSGWVTQGPRVAEFEQRLAERVGAREAVATTSCTTALFLALRALEIGPGDEVIVPSLSFIASANAILHCGADPVFADIDPLTYNLDPQRLEGAVSGRTRAIMAVHQVGLPADLKGIEGVARAHDLIVVEDAACAIGSSIAGRAIGSGENLACFSFHPRKVVCTGEGGMITTNDSQLAARLRRLRHQGMDVSDLDRHHSSRVVFERYPELGYNFRMSDLHAALGLVQLEKLDGMLARRREIAARYREGLGDIDAIALPHVPEAIETNFQSYIIRLTGADEAARNLVIERMQERGIATRRGLMASHREPPHRLARRGDELEHTEAAADQTLVIPMHAELSKADQERVIEALCAVIASVCDGQSKRSAKS